MIAYCKYHGIGLIPWSPLSGGALARPAKSEETPRWKSFNAYGINKQHAIDAEIIKRVEEIAKKRGWAMSQVRIIYVINLNQLNARHVLQVALAWAQRTVDSPIVGFNSIKRVDQGIVNDELTDEEAKYLEEP